MAVPKPSPSLDLDFDEAVEYFRRHNAVTKDEWDKLDGATRRRAVRVASIAHRGMLNDVWKGLEKSLADGTDFRQFKAEIAATLRKKYGADGEVPAHLETIYLNETQRAFTHGRVVAALDPDVRKARPFWQFRAIEDTRITPICKECNGTIAEAGGAWWRSHLPPLHHRCRSSFVPLTPAEAGRRGGTTSTPPQGGLQKGFGEMPDLDDDGTTLQAVKSAQLPRELRPRLELAIPSGPPGHPERPPKPERPGTPGDPVGEPVGEEIGEPIFPPAAERKPPKRPSLLDTAKDPHNRHFLERIDKNSRPHGDVTSVALPEATQAVRADVVAVRSGEGAMVWLPTRAPGILVTSRTYGWHGAEVAGRPALQLYPIAGEGIVRVSRAVYKVLVILLGSPPSGWAGLRASLIQRKYSDVEIDAAVAMARLKLGP